MTFGTILTRFFVSCCAAALPLALCLTPTAAAAQARESRGKAPADSMWLLLRPDSQISLFGRLYVPPDADPGRLSWYPLARELGPHRSSSFMTGLMASAVSRAACGPNRVCRFYLEDAYQKEYGRIPERAGWLGGLLGRALLPEFDRWGLNIGSDWWPEIRTQTDP